MSTKDHKRHAEDNGKKNATPKKHKVVEKQVTPKKQPPESIPGFEDIGDGVIRGANGAVDFEESVKRIAELVPKYIKHTPQYNYELLSQLFNCTCNLKLENLQLFGDIYVRNCMGAILGNYFNQRKRIGKELFEVRGIVLVMDPEQPHDHQLLDGIVLTAIHMKQEAVVYVAPGKLTLLQCVMLHSCHERGAKVIFHKGDTPSCLTRAKKHADDLHMIFIEHQFTEQFAIIGAATVGYEMLQDTPTMDTIIMPLRLYQVGWSYVCGISLYAKHTKPDIRVVVVQMTEDIARLGESGFGKESDKNSLFPDKSEAGWLSLVQEKSSMRAVFDTFDAKNKGVLSASDLENIITQMGGDSSRFRPQLTSTVSLTDFLSKTTSERIDMLTHTWTKYSEFLNFFALDNLKAKGFVDEVVEVSEDQAVGAFIKCLEFSHTLTNGKGSIALAGLFSGKVHVKKAENIVVLIMGGFIDMIDFQTLFDYGLDLIGQNFEIEMDLPDSTTALSSVLKVISEKKVSVYEVTMDRSGDELRQYHVRIRIQCRSRNFEQQQDVLDAITNMGFRCRSTRTGSSQSAPSLPFSPVLISNQPSAPASQPPAPSSTPLDPNTPKKADGNPKAADDAHPIQPRTMESVTVDTIRDAYKRIKGNLNRTPIYLSQTYSKLCKCKMYLMLENIQKTGSFKIRGSSNMVLKALGESSERPKGLVAASAGNHAQGVALVSNKVGLPCTIVCPEYAPESKLLWTRSYGAEVIKNGNSLEEATRAAEKIRTERGWKMVYPFNDVDVIEGQGTMGCEIYEQIPDVDTVVVNVGGGGMIAGIAAYMKGMNPNIRIVGVQSENVSPLADFKTTHMLRYIEPAALTLADGTNVKLPGGVHTKILAELVDEYVTVSENEIASTIVHLMENSRTLSEGAGCLGLAALINHKIQVRKDEKVCVVICGGNIDMSTLRQVYEYGLRSLGRLFTIHTSTWDYPGNLAKMISLAARAGMLVREIRHIRGKGDINWNEVTISLMFYSNSFQHQQYFLTLMVAENMFPKIIGRKYIKDHESIYKEFDQAVQAKKEEMSKKHQEHQEQFMNWSRQQSSTIF